MEDYYIGQILLFAGNFIPNGWHKCNGATFNIADHTSLFSLIGFKFGGDGHSKFCVPDLGEGVLMGSGKISGDEEYKVGQRLGQRNKIITDEIMPSHDHNIKLMAYSGSSNKRSIEGNCLASGGMENEYSTKKSTGNMHEGTIEVENSGGGEAIDNAQPCLVLHYCICYEGYYPSRQ